MHKVNEMLFFVLPMFLFWDALAMMLIGMALFKSGVLQADRSESFYLRVVVIGFGVGLLVNGYEVVRSINTNLDIFHVFAQMQWTYHFGRLGMAFGYLGLVVLAVKKGWFTSLLNRLAATGRMALTNYLMHSLICGFIFTGMGLGLMGQLDRPILYCVVFGIWALQLWLSPYWLSRYKFGPVEWLWRYLTYGTAPAIVR